ncbi:hypothetical protein SLS62_001811 [Diatrype stigma]|uniref:Uncharacterized protein n=1 Tax=Diatrype stigma TaxID=117547 RepID=A0AAN9V9W4_9PEZI
MDSTSAEQDAHTSIEVLETGHCTHTSDPAPHETSHTAYRTLYLVSFIPSRLFPAHWAMWVPDQIDNKGSLISVQGDPGTGFVHEILRNYDPKEDERRPWFKAIGEIEERLVQEPSEATRGVQGRSALEKVALSIPAPEKSLRSGSHKNKTATIVFQSQMESESMIPRS